MVSESDRNGVTFYFQYDGYEAPRQQYAPQQQGYYKKKRKESWLSELFD